MSPFSGIRGIVFDLDGTLYVNDRFAAEILNVSATYVAQLRGVTQAEAAELLTATRQRLSASSGSLSAISTACLDLGGTVQELHRYFEQNLQPDEYLVRDDRVVRLLKGLAGRFSLYIYTNNNRLLTTRILQHLGLDGIVHGIFTIDDTWLGKPDREMVRRLLEKVGLSPCEALFVGDRYDVDLRQPEQLGCPVYLSQSLEQLLQLEELLIKSPSSDTPAAPADLPVARS